MTERKCSHTDMLHAVNPTRENFVTLEPNGLSRRDELL